MKATTHETHDENGFDKPEQNVNKRYGKGSFKAFENTHPRKPQKKSFN